MDAGKAEEIYCGLLEKFTERDVELMLLRELPPNISAADVEEALSIARENSTDCTCGSGIQFYFWLPSEKQSKFLGSIKEEEIKSALARSIVLWCTGSKRIEVSEDGFDILLFKVFEWEPTKKQKAILERMDRLKKRILIYKATMYCRIIGKKKICSGAFGEIKSSLEK